MEEPTFDILGETQAKMLEPVVGLSTARQRMEQIAAEKPGRYFLFCGTRSCNRRSTLPLRWSQPTPPET